MMSHDVLPIVSPIIAIFSIMHDGMLLFGALGAAREMLICC
jgi:hypothetical protein